VIDDAASVKRERDLKKGIRNRPVRLMICGIPNVGKSTFINSLCRKNIAKTGNKPGVTKGKQWISVRKGVELMDTPGILWPRIDDPGSQRNLAMIGSMNDEAINKDDLIVEIVNMLKEKARDTMTERFGISASDDTAAVLYKTAEAMSMKRSGGEPDTKRAAEYLMTEYRNGGLGRISLEEPQ
jgi:ribosome biogenesis GTPase A